MGVHESGDFVSEELPAAHPVPEPATLYTGVCMTGVCGCERTRAWLRMLFKLHMPSVWCTHAHALETNTLLLQFCKGVL